jgi:hypothetical protein
MPDKSGRRLLERHLLRAVDGVTRGRRCRRTCRRAARSGRTSTWGTGTARSAASITSFLSRFGTRQAGRPARPRPSLTARAPGEPSKGGLARPVRLRCGHDGAGPQAPHPDLHARPVAGGHRSPSPCSGPGRGEDAAAGGPTELSLDRAHHRRCGLSRSHNGSGCRPDRRLGASDRSPL